MATYSLADTAIEGVEVIEDNILGQGSYGVVYKAKYFGSPVAAKRLHSIFFESGTGEDQVKGILEGFSKELALLKMLKHPNIVEFLGVFNPNKEARNETIVLTENSFIVCEIMVTSLQDRLVKQPHLSFRQIVDISAQITYGLRYLHERESPIMHRDLAPKNVLLNWNGEAKIADLGVAKAVGMSKETKQSNNTRHPGTDSYMPVEVRLANAEYNEKIDIFAVGVILLEMAISRNSYASEPFYMSVEGLKIIPEQERRKKDFSDLRNHKENGNFEKIVSHCLEEKTKRPSAKELSACVERLKEHPYYLSSPETSLLGDISESSEQLKEKEDCEALKVKSVQQNLKLKEVSEQLLMMESTLNQLKAANAQLQGEGNKKDVIIEQLMEERSCLEKKYSKTSDQLEVALRRIKDLEDESQLSYQMNKMMPAVEGIYPTFPPHHGRVKRTNSENVASQSSGLSRGHLLPSKQSTLISGSLEPPHPTRSRLAVGSGYSQSLYPSYTHSSGRKSELVLPSSNPRPTSLLVDEELPSLGFDHDPIIKSLKVNREKAKRKSSSFDSMQSSGPAQACIHRQHSAIQHPEHHTSYMTNNPHSSVTPRSTRHPRNSKVSSSIPPHISDTELGKRVQHFRHEICSLIEADQAGNSHLLAQAKKVRQLGENLQSFLDSSDFPTKVPRDHVDTEEVPKRLQIIKEYYKLLKIIEYLMGCAVTEDSCILKAAKTILSDGRLITLASPTKY